MAVSDVFRARALRHKPFSLSLLYGHAYNQLRSSDKMWIFADRAINEYQQPRPQGFSLIF